MSPNALGQGHGPKRPMEVRAGVGRKSTLIRRCRDTFSHEWEKDGMVFVRCNQSPTALLSFSLWEKVPRQRRMRALFLSPQTRLICRVVGGRTLFGTIGDMDVAN